MPAHPVSRLVRFALAVGTNVIFDHLGYRRPTVLHPCVDRDGRAGWLPCRVLPGPGQALTFPSRMLRIAGQYADGVVLWMASAAAIKSTVSLLVDERRTGADDVSCRAG